MKIFMSILLSAYWMTIGFAQSPELQSAIRPMEEGIPDVAIVRLREMLSQPLSLDEHRMANEKLGVMVKRVTILGRHHPTR